MPSAAYDFIIVGAGSAGCVLANRLSADPAHLVLLLEAGGWDRNFWLKLPVAYFRSIFDDRLSRQFPTEPGPGTAGRSIVWPRGRVIGGSSSINGLIFIRGQQEDLDDWARQGAHGWDYQSVLPYFRRAEEIDRDAMVAGVKTLREIYRQPAFRDLWDKEVLPGPEAVSDEDILEFVRGEGGHDVPLLRYLPDGRRRRRCR